MLVCLLRVKCWQLLRSVWVTSQMLSELFKCTWKTGPKAAVLGSLAGLYKGLIGLFANTVMSKPTLHAALAKCHLHAAINYSGKHWNAEDDDYVFSL